MARETWLDALARGLAGNLPRRELLRRGGLALLTLLVAPGQPREVEAAKPKACAPPRPDPCGKKCVDLKADKKNCGACGAACPKPRTCANGRCASAAMGRSSAPPTMGPAA